MRVASVVVSERIFLIPGAGMTWSSAGGAYLRDGLFVNSKNKTCKMREAQSSCVCMRFSGVCEHADDHGV